MLVLRILIWFAPIIAVALPANPLNDADVSEVYTEGEIADPAIGLTPSEREQAELLEEFLKDSSELVSRDDVGDDDDDQLSAPGDEDDPETVKKLAGPLPAALGLLACRTNINVYFKSWYWEPTPDYPSMLRDNGYIRDEDITNAIKRLNSDFFTYGFRFTPIEHIRVRYTNQDLWDSQYVLTPKEDTVKTSLAYKLAQSRRPLEKRPKRWERNLFIYIPHSLKSAGFSNLPSSAKKTFAVTDGIFIGQDTFPGGAAPIATTLSHEAGHWLGLKHTFEGGCDDLDEVVDTLAVAKLTDSQRRDPLYSGCPTVGVRATDLIYTCPQRKYKPTTGQKLAAVQNFMSYSMDACRNRFSKGQVQKMRTQSSAYRSLLNSCTV